MARPTEEAEALFKSAHHRFNQSVLHLSHLNSGVPVPDPWTADQITFNLGLAIDDLARGQVELARGLERLSVAIRQVYDKK